MTKVIRTCAAKGCDRRLYGKGYCQTHYARPGQRTRTGPPGGI